MRSLKCPMNKKNLSVSAVQVREKPNKKKRASNNRVKVSQDQDQEETMSVENMVQFGTNSENTDENEKQLGKTNKKRDFVDI